MNNAFLRSWLRFFVASTVVGGLLYWGVAMVVGLCVGIVVGPERDPRNVAGTIAGFVAGFGAFAWISYLTYVRAARTLVRHTGAASRAASAQIA